MTNKFFKKDNRYLHYLVIFFWFISNSNYFAQKESIHKSQKKERIYKAESKKESIPIYSGKDGPYIINDTLFQIDSQNRLVIIPQFNKDSIIVGVDNIDKNEFFISLEKKYKIPKTNYDLPKKMVVISDIEGNYNAFASFLYSNNLIDKKHNWIYGDGHLVLVGDFFDRGKNVTQVLWLIYKLEQQAKKQNGVVHFILGNHEIMNFNGDFRYNRKKYLKAAQEISRIKNKKEALKYLYSANSELGKWLKTKNIIEKIGNYVFVHAGLNPNILNFKLSLREINNIARLEFRNKKRSKNSTTKFIFGLKGLFWYRGLFFKTKNYKKITPLELNRVLNYYDAEKIVIGHTHVKNVSTDFNGKVIRTDVIHGKQKFSSETQGLLIKNNKEFVIDANFTKKILR